MLPSDIPLPAVEEKSDFSFDLAGTKSVEVIGFPSEAEPKIVRLGGEMNRSEFWRVQVVIDELESVLRDRLTESEVLRSPNSPARLGPGIGRAEAVEKKLVEQDLAVDGTGAAITEWEPRGGCEAHGEQCGHGACQGKTGGTVFEDSQ
jgi:hypothetical protein